YGGGGYGGANNGAGSGYGNSNGGASGTQQQLGGYGGQQAQRRPDAPQAEPLSTEWLVACPHRTLLSEHVEQLPLDRRERMILLLVDGRRNLSDLARLTRRSEREVLAVLQHMATLGLVGFDG
ncbi:MAG: hypothetical protein ACHQ4H_14075, partial [Ktedonobacterales bacterium]